MGHESNISVIINILVQIVNLFIFFLIFKKFFADKILANVEKRKQLLDKIKNAESEYEKILSDADIQSKSIVEEAIAHKKNILSEAEKLAIIERQKIIDEATRKSQDILSSANIEAAKLKSELEENWAEGVKHTAKIIVKKIINTNPDIQDKYIDSLISEIKK